MKQKLYLIIGIVVAMAFVGFAGIASADVITFEDLWPGYDTFGTVPANYSGFNWSSYAYWLTKGYIPGSGYYNGTLGNVSIYTAFEEDLSMSSAAQFDFNGAYITSAWNIGEDATIEGWRNGSLIYSQDITTSYNGPYWFDFNFFDIDTLIFKAWPENGTNADLGGSGSHLSIDNITYNEQFQPNIPEPATMALIGAGLLSCGIFRKKRV